MSEVELSLPKTFPERKGIFVRETWMDESADTANMKDEGLSASRILKELIQEISGGNLQQLNVFPIYVPPLRERSSCGNVHIDTVPLFRNLLAIGQRDRRGLLRLAFAKRTLNYVNAGHDPPLVLRPKDGSCEIFRLPPGIPVGISADSQFGSTTFRFEIDDVLIAYTEVLDSPANCCRRQNPHQNVQVLVL
jgi:hypothetical protein